METTTLRDAGMDLNGWRLAAEVDSWPSDEDVRPRQAASKKSWWWVVDDQWILSFRELDGYRSVMQQPYSKWMPPSTATVHALRRQQPQAP